MMISGPADESYREGELGSWSVVEEPSFEVVASA